MIRINLLGVAKPKRGRRSAAAVGGGGGGANILVIALIIGVLTAGANYYWYFTLQKDAADLQKQIADADRESRRLSDIKAKYFELKKQKEILERRVNVIHELQKNQSGPSELLALIGDTVNKTDAVWLENMAEDNSSLTLNGRALSVNAVATLMKNLKSTGQFKSVEIKETLQDDNRQMQTFQFSLVCEKQPPQQKS
jgi:type IV pilus assembly protein PilN